MIIIKLSIVYFFTQVYIICVESQATSDTSKIDNFLLYRLPTTISPISYNITLLTNVTRGDFSCKGIVIIDLNITTETKEIVLHSDNLKIDQQKSVLEKVTELKVETLQIQSQTYDNETQFYKIVSGNSLAIGQYRLALHFDCEVVDDYYGFYRSSYIKNNQRRWIGVTELEATYARRAFPCMDEPGFKATFQLNLGHYSKETVSSNTLAESKHLILADEKLGDYYITRFARTPSMSTYLLAWAVHDFQRLNSTKSYMWLWTRSQTLKLNNSPLLLEAPLIEAILENYPGIPTPLRKFEQIPVPDYDGTGIENWGIITYSEQIGLIDYTSTPPLDIFNGLAILSHEYAHSYFGNLVTPSFWDGIWLNEAFAVYFSFLNLDSLHKDWRTMEFFSVAVLQSALLADSFPGGTRTMNSPVLGSRSSTEEIFDFNTYSKGASILSMIADVLGAKSFQHASQSYLRRWQYGSVTPKNLYDELDSVASGLPTNIGEIFDSYANQTNYPLVQAVRNGNQVKLTQRSFDFSGNTTAKRWWIPIRLITPSFESKLHWLPNNNESISIELPENSPWFVVNPRLSGYYRVDYDMENWQALISFLRTGSLESLPSVSRAALLDDAWCLVRANLRNYSLPMSLAEYLVRERDYMPWYSVSQIINLLDRAYQSVSDTLNTFRKFVIPLITPIYEELSIKEEPSDSLLRKMHRELILNAACLLDYEPCVSAAKSHFDRWITNDTEKIPSHFKSFAYRTAIINGTDQDWENLWARFLQTNSSSLDKRLMMEALLVTKNTSYLKRLLDFANHPETDIQKQFRQRIVQVVGSVQNSNVSTASDTVQKISANVVSLRRSKRTLNMADNDIGWIDRLATGVLEYTESSV